MKSVAENEEVPKAVMGRRRSWPLPAEGRLTSIPPWRKGQCKMLREEPLKDGCSRGDNRRPRKAAKE
jgi:hypothetical protein